MSWRRKGSTDIWKNCFKSTYLLSSILLVKRTALKCCIQPHPHRPPNKDILSINNLCNLFANITSTYPNVLTWLVGDLNLPSIDWKNNCTKDSRAHAVSSGFSVFSYRGKKRYFSCSSLSIALCNGASIHEYKAYWHRNFSLINGPV